MEKQPKDVIFDSQIDIIVRICKNILEFYDIDVLELDEIIESRIRDL